MSQARRVEEVYEKDNTWNRKLITNPLSVRKAKLRASGEAIKRPRL
jgi:hypothetical protein